jgi:hypothetical protein
MNFSKRNILVIASIAAIVIGLILGLAIGIPLSQSKQDINRKLAQDILENNLLIDGFK